MNPSPRPVAPILEAIKRGHTLDIASPLRTDLQGVAGGLDDIVSPLRLRARGAAGGTPKPFSSGWLHGASPEGSLPSPMARRVTGGGASIFQNDVQEEEEEEEGIREVAEVCDSAVPSTLKPPRSTLHPEPHP